MRGPRCREGSRHDGEPRLRSPGRERGSMPRGRATSRADVVDAAAPRSPLRPPARPRVRLITGPRAWPSNHEAQLFGRRSSLVRVLVVGGAHRHAHRSLAHRRVAAPSPTALPVSHRCAASSRRRDRVPSWFTLSTHATLLADGRVLVQAADGTIVCVGTVDAIIRALGTTGVWRAQSTLFAMPDGRVAIVGGDIRRIDATSGVAVASTIEFFDPETGGSSPAVPMNVPRYVERRDPAARRADPRGWRQHAR